MTDMAFAFLLLLCSSKLILGELDIMGTEELKEVYDGVKIGEASEAGELDMGELVNRVNVLDTMERVGRVEDLVDVKELKEMKELKAVGEPREKRASFYKSGSEMAYQV